MEKLLEMYERQYYALEERYLRIKEEQVKRYERLQTLEAKIQACNRFINVKKMNYEKSQKQSELQ